MDLSNINKSVLFVDDNERTSRNIIHVANRANVAVQVASNANTAMTIIERDPERFFLVLTDQGMPGSSGIEFLQVIKSRWPFIERALVSGESIDSFIKDAYQKAGIYRFIRKPFSDVDIFRLMQDCYTRYQDRSSDTSSVIPERGAMLAAAVSGIIKHDDSFASEQLRYLEDEYLRFCQSIWNHSNLYRLEISLEKSSIFKSGLKRRIYESVKSIYKFANDKYDDGQQYSFLLSSALEQFNFKVKSNQNRAIFINEFMFTAFLIRFKTYLDILGLSLKDQVRLTTKGMIINFGSPFGYNDIYNYELEHTQNGVELAILNLEMFCLLLCMQVKINHHSGSWPELSIEFD